MIELLLVLSLSFVLLLTHIHVVFAEQVACPESTKNPCGKGSHSTCDINNLCRL